MSDFKDSGGGGQFLKAADLTGDDGTPLRIPVRISHYKSEEFKDFNTGEPVQHCVLYFNGKEKGAVVSGPQKWEQLRSILGGGSNPDIDKWIGGDMILTVRQTEKGPGVWFESAKISDADVPF